MKQFIIIALLVASIAAQSSSITPCTCAQLLSQGDCTASTSGCSWNSTSNACATSTTPVTPTVTYAQYCDNYSETDCPKTNGCAWVSSKCVFFTGCTPYAKTTDTDCQAISNKCITDGTHCVEVTTCSAFAKQLPCVKNSSGRYCYWDTVTNAALPACVDASTCDKLPAILTTDALCRAQLSTCTTTGAGCVTSGTNCADQTAQISCVWNLAMNQACYWNGSACVDLKCDNAPTTLTTDDACKAFTTSGTCTTKSGGGCITRTTCAAATIQAACVTNSSNSACYWNGTACVDKTCANAPSTLTTNTACSGFLSSCITTGSGCVTNTTCSSATVQVACVANAAGTTCIWDTTCKEKTCANAPSSNNTHSLCTTYLGTCTVNAAGNGCQSRTCANAPTSLVSNSDCETYLPNSKCITKSGGGCVTNTTCAAITVQGACVADQSGTVCFWDPTGAGSCKDKICTNAPSSYTDDATCSGYLKTCTVASGGAGCVNRTCENLLTSALCTTDLNSKPCIYKGLCYMKQCALASSAFNTHADCNGYLGSCTVSNTGSGCVPIPLVCSAITNQAACVLKKQVSAAGVVTYGNCGWNGSSCIDFGCTTLATTNTTTAQCEAAYASHYCVSANPVSGTVAGCMDLPTTCGARKTQDNCEVASASGTPKCIWNLTLGTPACVDRSCDTASAAGTLDVVTTFTNTNCSNYLSTCIANNTATGCQAKTASCTSLASTNCLAGAKTSGDCYYTGSSCVDKTCANISGSTHGGCIGTLSSCTVKADASGCMSLAATCSTYTSSLNCQVTSAGKNCAWTGTQCRSAVCNDATDGTAYDTDGECLTYPAVSETCTVVYKVGGSGCVSRSANCSDYTSQAQCYRTLGAASAASDDCIWTSLNICLAKSSFATGACSTFKGTQTDCQSYRVGCTNVAGATSTTACTFDCARKTGTGLTFSDCNTFDSTCSVNLAGTACITKQAACSGYTTAAGADCVQISTTGLCVWNTSSTACEAITAAASCAYVPGTGLTHTQCQAYSTLCTAVFDGADCQEYKATCNLYTGSANVCSKSQAGLCVWDTTTSGSEVCKSPSVVADCAFVISTGLTDATCATYLAGCKANAAGTACMEAKATCDLYATSANCANATTDGKCYWDATAASAAGACIKVATASTQCALITTASITHSTCQTYNTGCTYITSGGCQEWQAACSSYTTSAKCVTNSAGAKCYWDTTANSGSGACIQISTASTDCAKVTSGVSTFANCQAYNTNCSINRAGTACVELKSTCGGYTAIANCAQTSATALCIASSSADTTCVAATTAATCDAVYLGSGNYNDANCNKFKAGCTNNGSTGCTARTCANYTGGAASHTNCNTWLSTCTLNVAGSGCVTMPAKCNDAGQTAAACILRATEGECIVYNSACVKKTCETAATGSAFDTDGECSALLNSCTVARTGGCQARTACASYKSSLQCKFNSSGSKCFWNPTALTCVDLQCANVEQTTSYDSHSECYNVDSTTLKCTVRAASGAAVAGCMARTACSSYTISDQCVTNSTGGACEWNTNLATPACADKACSTAATGTYATHVACNGYLSTCTSAVVDVSGTPTLQGCQSLAACNTYTMSDQCVVDASGNACGWNGSTCANKSCATAPAAAEYSSDAQCRAYLAGCTVAAAGQGCVAVAACESYTASGQCVSNTTGALCYWNATSNTCYTRTCENAPADTADSTACNTYLTGCTLDSVKCKTKICEDFALATDALCSAALSTCTSNGTNCVTRGTCAQATTSTACVTQSNGAQCQWVAASGTVAAYCTVKTCATAPTDIVTESGCQSYFTGCTTKNNGGCVVKSTCAAANVQAACTKDVSGNVCQWDSTANACRNKACGDYSGSTHATCQGISTSCTAGNNGYCATISTCANTKVRAACIQGTDGPCLWIAGYTNSDGTSGACFPYTSCKSLSWSSNTQCNLISSNCTTNGTNCVGITLCTETNTNGGCVNGYDGACIQSVDALGSTNAPTCRAYTSCADAFYATHAACQTASSKCTTNGTTGCIALGACSTYTQAGCYFNNVGVVSSSGAITSTGVCTWDTTTSACRDQSCADLVGTNNAACSAQLSTCTSDGTNCIAKAACSTYAQAGCSSGIGVGTDGVCFWDSTATTPACRPMVCGDVTGGTSTAVCSVGLSGCVSDGAKCIAKAACSTYTTKTSCNSGGTDGVCVFTASTATGAAAGSGTCKAITQCTDAASDQVACTAVKDRCAWTAATTGTNATASKCTTHTCATYQSTVGVCGNFKNWAKTLQQVCTIVNSTCTATDASTLTSANCYSVSGYTYTWSSTSSKCGVCTTPVVTPNNTNSTNNTNNTNGTTTTHGYILGFASVVLGYLVL